MPKVPTYTVAWSSSTQAYTLYAYRDRRSLSIVAGSPAWFVWLDHTSEIGITETGAHLWRCPTRPAEVGDGDLD